MPPALPLLCCSWLCAACRPASCTAGWQAALTQDTLLRLGLLLSRSQGDAMARLRSDLQEQQLDLCHHHIEVAPAAERRSISLLDVEARLRLQQEFVQEALRCWDGAIEQARAEGQFKWAIALVRRRHAANMVHLKGISSKAIAYEAELDRISGFLSSVAKRYGIELTPPSSTGDDSPPPQPPRSS